MGAKEEEQRIDGHRVHLQHTKQSLSVYSRALSCPSDDFSGMLHWVKWCSSGNCWIAKLQTPLLAVFK